jgi:hypothetical protein
MSDLSLSKDKSDSLLEKLKFRFEINMIRHENIEWQQVKKRLEQSPHKLWSLYQMEETGGEPDVVAFDSASKEYVYIDCSAESPVGRRNTCYDEEGQKKREKNGIHPNGNALDMSQNMGIELLSEEHYRSLQKIIKIDLKTSSWLKTPTEIRKLGGALFADRRYDHVFVYHNGAQSFYSARGFRGLLRI